MARKHENFVDWMRRKKMKPADLAESVGVSRQNVYLWLGGSHPSCDVLARLEELSKGALGAQSFLNIAPLDEAHDD